MYIRPDNKSLITPIEKGRQRKGNKILNSYADGLEMAYEGLFEIRFGLSECIFFRWFNWRKEVNHDYTKNYSKASKELSLYSTAVRQLDPLSEFLAYYRIIESISPNGHKEWIEYNLPKLKHYDFGFLELHPIVYVGRRKNLFTAYKRRASS